jgi:hypothetical protein
MGIRKDHPSFERSLTLFSIYVAAFFDYQMIGPVAGNLFALNPFHQFQQPIFKPKATSFNLLKSLSVICPASKYAYKPDTLSPSEPSAIFRNSDIP